MKKLALIALVAFTVLAISLNTNNDNPTNSQKTNSMTGKIINIYEDSLYVEVLTGLHFDKAVVQLSTDSNITKEDLKKYSPSDVLVFSVSYIDNSTGQAIITTNNITSLKDKMTQ